MAKYVSIGLNRQPIKMFAFGPNLKLSTFQKIPFLGGSFGFELIMDVFVMVYIRAL
jgi:hypothetical protein